MGRILLIDDRRVSLDLASTLLRSDGHDLVEATDALAGLHRAVEDAPDCIVADFDLAGLDGVALCRAFAGEAATRAIPVVLWGTQTGRDAGALARAAGAFAFVDRERAPQALRGVVRQALLSRIACALVPAAARSERSDRLAR